MKQYKTRSWGTAIEEIEIIRKSKSMVWLMKGGHERRESSLNYFDTWEDAKDSIVSQRLNEVEAYQVRLNNAKEALEEAQNLTKPEYSSTEKT